MKEKGMIRLFAWIEVVLHGMLLAALVMIFWLGLFEDMGQTRFSVTLDIVIFATAVSGAAGVLFFREWGRRLLLAGAAASIAYQLISLGMDAAVEGFRLRLTPGGFVNLFWYGWLLFFFTRTNIRRVFHAGADPVPD